MLLYSLIVYYTLPTCTTLYYADLVGVVMVEVVMVEVVMMEVVIVKMTVGWEQNLNPGLDTELALVLQHGSSWSQEGSPSCTYLTLYIQF